MWNDNGISNKLYKTDIAFVSHLYIHRRLEIHSYIYYLCILKCTFTQQNKTKITIWHLWTPLCIKTTDTKETCAPIFKNFYLQFLLGNSCIQVQRWWLWGSVCSGGFGQTTLKRIKNLYLFVVSSMTRT